MSRDVLVCVPTHVFFALSFQASINTRSVKSFVENKVHFACPSSLPNRVILQVLNRRLDGNLSFHRAIVVRSQ